MPFVSAQKGDQVQANCFALSPLAAAVAVPGCNGCVSASLEQAELFLLRQRHDRGGV